tara:strand:- start:2433 stop:2861 length:429 start_codon:yes stop_codon:yes gene_type:complete
MELEGIINVSGKPGLFKVISKSNNTVIIESLTDKKRTAIYSHNQANLLEEIGIYTYNDTIPLNDIFTSIAKKTKCGPCINHNLSKEELTNYFREILPEYDEDRVYISDIKKIIQWYNIMQSVDLIKIQKNKKENKKEETNEI